jgi:hypothetical protein
MRMASTYGRTVDSLFALFFEIDRAPERADPIGSRACAGQNKGGGNARQVSPSENPDELRSILLSSPAIPGVKVTQK